MASWMAESGLDAGATGWKCNPGYKRPKLLGYIPAPLHADFCALAIVYECPECFTKYWTHNVWVGIDKEQLSKAALELLGPNEF